MDNNDRTWMYRRLENGFLTNEYCVGVESFVTFALSHPECLLNGNIRCPCNRKKCQNKIYLDEDTVKLHLGRYGFVPNYYCWFFHGEQYIRPFYPNINMNVPSSSYRSTGVGTCTTKHIAGSKTYSAHGHSLQAMEAYMDESLTPLDDETIPDAPSPEEVNSMFKHVVGGPKNGRMYGRGCGSMASTKIREEWETQKKVNELFRIDLQTIQTTLQAIQDENSVLKDRMTILEDQVRYLVAGLPHEPPAQTHRHTSGRFLYDRGSSNRKRSVAGTSRVDPFAAGSSHRRFSGKVLLRYSQEYVPPSQDFGHNDGDEDEDEDEDEDADDGDGDDDEAYDDDETHSP